MSSRACAHATSTPLHTALPSLPSVHTGLAAGCLGPCIAADTAACKCSISTEQNKQLHATFPKILLKLQEEVGGVRKQLASLSTPIVEGREQSTAEDVVTACSKSIECTMRGDSGQRMRGSKLTRAAKIRDRADGRLADEIRDTKQQMDSIKDRVVSTPSPSSPSDVNLCCGHSEYTQSRQGSWKL